MTNLGSDFGAWSNVIGSSKSAAALPSEFAGFPRSSKGFADLPRDVYAEPEAEDVSRTTNGSSTMLAVDLEVGTGGFILLSSVTFLESTVSMRNCHELSHIGLEEFGKLLQLTLRERKDVTDFTIYSFNYCNRCAYTQESSRANNVIYHRECGIILLFNKSVKLFYHSSISMVT